MISSVITGTGKFIPEKIVPNADFLEVDFYDENHQKIDRPTAEIIQKFEAITEIRERRYLDDDKLNSDMATEAAKQAIETSGVDKETLDYVLVAHNFGDISADQRRVDLMPTISAKVKNKLGIKNNRCRPYDVSFGCPGWVEAMIMADQYIKSGMAKKVLVIGSETISRAVDPYDRNRMIFADGAGAAVVEAKETEEPVGILGYLTISDNMDELNYLVNGPSLNLEYTENDTLVNMKGRKIYEYALKKVPAVIKTNLEEAGVDISEVAKVFLHQANAKMDHAMVERLFRLYKITDYPKDIAPMTVQFLGNTSVATVPTMYDMVLRGELGQHQVHSGDVVVFASVGAGMNINSIVYKIP